ncbi:hypothetical protein ILUMI_27499, partial [Ignelater luminosus]
MVKEDMEVATTRKDDNNADSSAKGELESQKLSADNIKSKNHVKGMLSKHTSAKLSNTKTKVQVSSSSVLIKKTVKSTASAVTYLSITSAQLISTFQIRTEEPIVSARQVTNRTFATRTLAPTNENCYTEQELIVRNECYTKNHELPTIASKMKQVTKCYLQSFNFKSEPISAMFPTLAHTISLADGKLQRRPLSTLVSTLSSKIGYGRSQCPLIRNLLNYNQLEEMAKEIPEEP